MLPLASFLIPSIQKKSRSAAAFAALNRLAYPSMTRLAGLINPFCYIFNLIRLPIQIMNTLVLLLV